MPDEEWPTDPAQRAVILTDFDLDTEFGDRRQEIVFIGAGMEEADIARQLDSALLSDEEMAKYSARYAAVWPCAPSRCRSQECSADTLPFDISGWSPVS